MFELSRESDDAARRADLRAPERSWCATASCPPARACPRSAGWRKPDRRQSLHGGRRLRAPGRARPHRVACRPRLLRDPARRLSAPLTAVEALPDPGTDAIALARLTLSQWADLIPAGSGFLPENWLLGGRACQRAHAPGQEPPRAAVAAVPTAGTARAARAHRRPAGARAASPPAPPTSSPPTAPRRPSICSPASCSPRAMRCWSRTPATSCCSSSCAPTTCG